MRKPTKKISILALIVFLIYPIGSYAELPQGAVMTAGSATLDYSQAGVLNVNVGANQNIANWQSYSIGAKDTVNYNRDSSFTFLNRVVGSNPSQIFGAINAPNGKIFLINQSGVLFAPGSSVNAAGLTVSALDIRDTDFLAGRYTFFGKGGSVVNQGYISTPGGYVALLGSTVENSGVIEANLGKVILASGERITLGLDPQDMISVVIDEATAVNLENKDAAVNNKGKIKADGGKVILTAKTLDGVFKKAANNEGVIEAKSLVNKKGEVYLLGGMENDLVSNTGKIDVSATGSKVDGGFVELSANRVDFAKGIIDNSSASGKTGEVLIDPWDVTIDNAFASVLEASFGNYTIEAENDVNFNITNDDELNLLNFDSGEYFKILAGRNINFNNDSIITNGADIILNADKDFWYIAGATYPKQWTNTADGIGSINLGSGSLKSNGGSIELKAGEDINLGTGSIESSGGQVTLAADFFFPYDAHATTYKIIKYNSGSRTETIFGAAGRTLPPDPDPDPDPVNYLAIDPRIRNIYHPMFRTVIIDRQTPTGAYFYHPLVLSDSSAFDGIALNAGAYDFIDGNLGLKGDNDFSPFYQNEDGNKKNKGRS
jgi:filamentous hemagglutinin family protein